SSSAVCSAGGICGTAATRAAVYSEAMAGPSSATARRTETSGGTSVDTASVCVTDDLQGVSEIVGVRRLVLDVLPRVRVLEAEPGPGRVQPLPLEPDPPCERRVGAVGQVTDARVLERAHVHPDLVGAAGLEVDLQERGEPMGLEGLVVGHAVTALGHHRELVV